MPFFGSCALALALVTTSASTPTKFDGHWWLSATQEHRRGFLAGYMDCDVYDAHRDRFRDASWYTLERAITGRLETSARDRGLAVSALAVAAASQTPERRKTASRDGTADHGIFDGEYWRQASNEHRLGFVQGYLDCRRTPSEHPGSPSAHEPGWYVREISKWYGVDPKDESIADAGRSGVPIAVVLSSFDK